MAETGCDAVMIGRGALADPWIFRQAAGGAAPSRAEVLSFIHGYGSAMAAQPAGRRTRLLAIANDESKSMEERFTAPFTVLRLLTPLKMTYEAAKKRAEPYTKIVEELPEMRRDTVELVKKAVS